MTQEERQLLLKDLCARLPYGVKVVYLATTYSIQYIESEFDEIKLEGLPYTIVIGYVKPYLRPMYSMTEKEQEETEYRTDSDYVDYCNEHHFDYRGLIEKGLALEAPEGMYK